MEKRDWVDFGNPSQGTVDVDFVMEEGERVAYLIYMDTDGIQKRERMEGLPEEGPREFMSRTVDEFKRISKRLEKQEEEEIN